MQGPSGGTRGIARHMVHILEQGGILRKHTEPFRYSDATERATHLRNLTGGRLLCVIRAARSTTAVKQPRARKRIRRLVPASVRLRRVVTIHHLICDATILGIRTPRNRRTCRSPERYAPAVPWITSCRR